MNISDIDHLIEKAKRRQSGVDVIRLNGMIDALKIAVENTQKKAQRLHGEIETFAAKKNTYDTKLKELTDLTEFVEDKSGFSNALSALNDLSAECELEMEMRALELEQARAEVASNQKELAAHEAERARYPADVRANIVVTAEPESDDALLRLAAPLRKLLFNQKVVILGGVPGRASSQNLLGFLTLALSPKRMDWPDIPHERAINVAKNKSADLIIMFQQLLIMDVRKEALRVGTRLAVAPTMGKRAVLEAVARSFGVELT